jgi:nicotinamidase-related amidase
LKYASPDCRTSALLTIDVQRDFTNQIAGTTERLPAMRRVLDFYRQQGWPIVHIVRLYRADGANVDLCRRELIEKGGQIVIPGSIGAELVDPLKLTPNLRLDADLLLSGRLQQIGKNEWALYKPRWDAFYGTSLEEHLKELGISTVVVVGCNFPNCPRSTVYGASMRDFRVVLIADAVSGVYEQGLRELNNIGVPTPSTDEWLASI